MTAHGSGDIPQQELRVVLDDSARVSVLRLYGELDIATASTFRQQTQGLITRDLVVDLTGLDLTDSSGLRVLRALDARIGSRDAAVVIVSPPGSLPRRLLQYAGLDRTLSVCDSMADVRLRTPRGDVQR